MCLGKTGTADRPGSGQVRDADDARQALGNAGQAVLGDLLPFTVAQVGAFTGAAQRRDHVDATVDQALEALAECRQVKLFAGMAERGNGVAYDAVELCSHGARLRKQGRVDQFRQSSCLRRHWRA